MSKASAIMYSIANIFNWIMLLVGIGCIVMCVLEITHIVDFQGFSGSLVYWIIVVVTCCILVCLTRIAKDSHSSKAWDVLLMILGILSADIFYFLGGLFGVIARR